MSEVKKEYSRKKGGCVQYKQPMNEALTRMTPLEEVEMFRLSY